MPFGVNQSQLCDCASYNKVEGSENRVGTSKARIKLLLQSLWAAPNFRIIIHPKSIIQT